MSGPLKREPSGVPSRHPGIPAVRGREDVRGKVHVLPGAGGQADDGAAPIKRAEHAPERYASGAEVVLVAAGSLAVAVIVGAVGSIYGFVPAGMIAGVFVLPPLLEARRWWRGRRR